MNITTKMKIVLGIIANLSVVYAGNLNACFEIAATRYQIPVQLLKAIAMTETKMNPYAINVNRNKTYDIGLMQINSSWLSKLNLVGINREDLLDGCKNIQVGAWILASNIKEYGFNKKAIGAYNSMTPSYQEAYARKVLSNL